MKKISNLFHKIGKKRLVLFSLAFLLAITLSSAAIMSNMNSNTEFADVRIYLSPSNQYSNYYATGDTTEMEQCDKIAAATEQELKKRGFSVMVGQSGDTMENRCNESDAFGADMHIPIHTNAFDGEYVGGTRVFILGAEEYTPAECFLNSVGSISPGEDDKIDYMPNLYEIFTPQAETIYLECEFHDTVEGAQWIVNNTQSIARAIADGVYNYYSSLR